jgi:ribosomal protein L28
VFKANLQKKTIEVDGQNMQVTMCAKCIKRLKFDAKQAMVTA